MNKRHFGLLGAYAMMAMSNFQDNDIYEPKLNPEIIIEKKKVIPKGCIVFNIGKYEIIAINRKNAIRKALNLRKKDCL